MDSISNSNIYSTEFDLQKLNSLKTDWNIINSPFLFYPTTPINSTTSLYSLYAESQINSGINFELTPNVMLNQFQLANNWETKKRYGVFAKYLGIAQFMGVIGMAAVHISKFYPPPKGKIDLKKNKLVNPKH
jgi:hypothetical protein